MAPAVSVVVVAIAVENGMPRGPRFLGAALLRLDLLDVRVVIFVVSDDPDDWLVGFRPSNLLPFGRLAEQRGRRYVTVVGIVMVHKRLLWLPVRILG